MKNLVRTCESFLKSYNVLFYTIVIFNLFSLQVHGQDKTCFKEVDGNKFEWSYPSSTKKTIEEMISQPGTDYGFVFDIYGLDNSFNMEINGMLIATNEIQFQSSGTPGINIEFTDGDKYEANTVTIWNLVGNANFPIIRVEISPVGQVTMFGSKVSGGPLFSLQPITGRSNSFTFNTVPWNQNGANTIKVTQFVIGATNIKGYGYGRNIIPDPQVDAGKDQTVCEGTLVTLTADNPNGATISWDKGVSDGVPFLSLGGSTTYTVTADLDGCKGTDKVTVITPPSITSISCPDNLDAICAISEQPPYVDFNAFIAAGGSASIPSGGVIDSTSFILLSEVSDGADCPETVTRTYQIADKCGATVTCTQNIIVKDEIKPTGTAPADLSVQCADDVPTADISLVTDVTDKCTTKPTVTHVGDVSNGKTCPETITRTYKVEDDCGNFIEIDQLIIINDNVKPTAIAPADIEVQCIEDVPVVNINDVLNVSDNCTAVPTVTHVSDVSDGKTCPEVITRTYNIADDCGNDTSVVQIITINDEIKPKGTAPADITVQCIEDVPAVNINDVLNVSDNCTAVPTVTHVSDVSDGNTCLETITRTYNIVDACGNDTNVVQLISINNDIKPSGTPPADITVQCVEDVPAVDITKVLNVHVICKTNPVVSHVSDISDGSTCPEIITRTYNIANGCGGDTNVIQLITIHDDVKPTASNPKKEEIQCIDDISAPDINIVTDAADNCTATPTVTYVGDVSDGGTCPETITRTYKVEDDCGNFIEVEQLIVINDDTKPTASNPVQEEVQCIEDVSAPDINVVTDATDNCTAVPTVTYAGDVSDGKTCPETITRTYKVEDDCGNFIEIDQLIIINDDVKPTGIAPTDIAVQCIEDVPTSDITLVTGVSDNCTAVPTVTHVSDVSDGNTCPETITRIYKVEDDCGNFIEVEQLIIINDDIDPTASDPAPITVDCLSDAKPDPKVVTDVADNCTAVPTVAFESESSDGNKCNGEVITRIYSVTDDCGNSINVSQIITVDAYTPSFTVSSTNPTKCGKKDGTITLSGLSPSTDYELSYNGGGPNIITTNALGEYTITGLQAGAYINFTVANAKCPECRATEKISINLIDPNAPYINGGEDQEFCEGTMTELIANNPDGANISWNKGVKDGLRFEPPVGTNHYTVTAEIDSCFSTDVVSITVHPLPNVSAGDDIEVCDGERVTLSGTGAHSYMWDKGLKNGVAFTPSLGTTTYTVVGTSIHGCKASAQVDVTVHPNPKVSFITDKTEGCAPLEVNLISLSTTATDKCRFTINGHTQVTGCDVSHVFNSSGCYDIKLQVETENGCISDSTASDYICVDNYPIADFTFNPDELSTFVQEIAFTNRSTGAETYDWNFGDGGTSTQTNPVHLYSEDGKSYIVELIAYSNLGCPDTIRKPLPFYADLLYYVPNAFTPDQDQYNETFKPIFTSGFNPQEYSLLIFNRWGEVIFESNNAEFGWNGTYGVGSAKIVPDGVYIWKINFKKKRNNKAVEITGHVNLLR